MANNPLIAQGVLNRIRAAVSITAIPGLNVTASYLGAQGITMTLVGEATTIIPTMTGTVQSGEPYQQVNVSMHILKSQGLAAQYKSQMENTTNIGGFVVTPDATTLPTYTIENGAITGIEPMVLDGKDAGFIIRLSGFYVINNALWG